MYICVCIYILHNPSLGGSGGGKKRMTTTFQHTILVSACESFAEGARGESSCQIQMENMSCVVCESEMPASQL